MVILMQVTAINVLLTILVVFMVSLVGNMDMKDQQKQVEVYCKNVKEGVWPDYQRKYNSQC